MKEVVLILQKVTLTLEKFMKMFTACPKTKLKKSSKRKIAKSKIFLVKSVRKFPYQRHSSIRG